MHTGPPRTARKLRLLPLVAATYFIVSGGPYGLEDIIGMAGYGRALLLLGLVPLFWSFPTAMMVGELASAMPEEGGFYIWVRRALGNFWGFQEAWLSLAASVFDMALYPTTFVLYLSHIAPAYTAGHRGLAIKLAIVIVATMWNLRGAKSVGDGSVWMMLLSLSPFALLIVCGLWKAFHGGLGLHDAADVNAKRDLAGAVAVAMWNYMGWDNASTIAQEVDNPQRNYPRAMFASTMLVTVVYMLPIAAVWAAGIPAGRFTTGAWTDAATLLAGGALAMAIVITNALDGLGSFTALTLTLTRLPYALALDGLLPRVLTPVMKRDVPYVSVFFCALAWSMPILLGLSFERLISIDLVLYGSALVLEFLALIVLRVREPQMPRPFRAPGGLPGVIALGVGPTVLIGFAMWTARDEKIAGMNALIFSLVVGAAGALIYFASRAGRKSMVS